MQWIRRMLDYIKQPETKPMTLMVRNQAAISEAKNVAPTKRKKFIDIKRYHIRDHIQKGNITIKHILIPDNAADLITKINGPQRHNHLTELLQLTPHKVHR